MVSMLIGQALWNASLPQDRRVDVSTSAKTVTSISTTPLAQKILAARGNSFLFGAFKFRRNVIGRRIGLAHAVDEHRRDLAAQHR